MLVKFVCLLLTLNLAIQNVAAIYCNFTFIESDSENSTSSDVQVPIMTTTVNGSSNEVFDCEQSLDDLGDELEFAHVNDSTKIDNRFSSQENFELQELSCITSKRFITPRALNNVYNQLTTVLNTATVVQRIQTTECRTLREPCNEQIYPSTNFRYICWQEYLIIKLLALHNGGAVYDESFYYPSHCSCRLVKVTRRSRKITQRSNKVPIVYV